MASGFFAILDDIATLMDDMATMSKIAARKTAGILGDDLAVNAEKASGFASRRELPVLWAIIKGSFLNKLIILPVAFLLSAFVPWAITVILLLGGIYLAYEGAEKIYEFIVPHHSKETTSIDDPLSEEELLELEKKRVKAAIFTDFILSVEIVIVALGTVVEEPLLTQIIVTTIIAIAATIGVYGIVALIVRMDETGYKLIELSHNKKGILRGVGRMLVKALPKVIRGLTIIGTIALLLVSGGIFVHELKFLHHLIPAWPILVLEFLVGLAVGFAALLTFNGFKVIRQKIKAG